MNMKYQKINRFKLEQLNKANQTRKSISWCVWDAMNATGKMRITEQKKCENKCVISAFKWSNRFSVHILRFAFNLMMLCIAHFILVAVNSKFVAHKCKAYYLLKWLECYSWSVVLFLSLNNFESILHLKSLIPQCHSNFVLQANISISFLRE